ncbi:MAG: winged helix-turn-helix transcriptional regulator [Clostridia bacterium]|nr:winged helix-turn-helix transcriptional regulator [Clostridia bacterium]MBO7156544.1 winged helix-turn-helix transcriptional regulator [Clostridia bacterium]
MEEMLIDNPTLDLILDYLPTNADLADIASFFSVFGDVTRLKILSALAVEELCVSDLASIANLNQTTLSHQLKLLRDSGIVSTRRNGKIIYYRTINPYVNEAMLMGVNYLLEIIKK